MLRTANFKIKCLHISHVGLFFLLCFVVGFQSLHAQKPSQRGRGVPEVSSIDLAEAMERIESFRNQRLKGAYVFDFALRNMPRRGETQSFTGTLWGRWQDSQPQFRLRLNYPIGSSKNLDLIVHSGAEPRAWISYNGERPQPMPDEHLYMPIVPELNYTAFDLALSFMYWEDVEYWGPARVRGQPAHTFIMRAPSALPADIDYVQVILHANYNTLIEAEIINKNGDPIKSLRMRSFKEIQEQWIVSVVDFLDEQSKDKSRFSVMRAALDIPFPADYFTPQWTENYLIPRADEWSVVN